MKSLEVKAEGGAPYVAYGVRTVFVRCRVRCRVRCLVRASREVRFEQRCDVRCSVFLYSNISSHLPGNISSQI